MWRSLRSREQRALLDVLIEIREESGLAQRALAARLKRPRSYVSKMEGGERKIEVGDCVAWARACKIHPLKLFKRYVARLPGR